MTMKTKGVSSKNKSRQQRMHVPLYTMIEEINQGITLLQYLITHTYFTCIYTYIHTTYTKPLHQRSGHARHGFHVHRNGFRVIQKRFSEQRWTDFHPYIQSSATQKKTHYTTKTFRLRNKEFLSSPLHAFAI